VKAVVQRVIDASVTVDGILKGKINTGLLVYLGVAVNDSEDEAGRLAEKIVNLRIFNDTGGKMNLSLKEIISIGEPAGVLAISQFTLLADTRKGRRPSWNTAAPPERAKQIYGYFTEKIRSQNIICENGEFQAHMKVSYINDGPVTIILDSKELTSR
jgi:D-tyrosyl-tRNA(Tyr) deacylase